MYIIFITIYPTLAEMIKEYRFEKACLNNRKILIEPIPSIMSSAGIFSSILFSSTVCAYLSIYQVAYCHSYDFSVCGQDSDKKNAKFKSRMGATIQQAQKVHLGQGQNAQHGRRGCPTVFKKSIFRMLGEPSKIIRFSKLYIVESLK